MNNIRNFLFVAFSIISINYTVAQGLNKNGQIIANETSFISKNGAIGYGGISQSGQFQLTSNSLGQFYQGGIIIYTFISGDPGFVSGQVHGLIAAQTDLSPARAWGCSGVDLSGAAGTALGTGIQNTLDIVAGCATTTTPARLCDNLSLNGYTDWFLPSKDELSLVYASRASIGGFAVSYYWSSTETTATLAWARHFTTSTNVTQGKSNSYRIRPVRNF